MVTASGDGSVVIYDQAQPHVGVELDVSKIVVKIHNAYLCLRVSAMIFVTMHFKGPVTVFTGHTAEVAFLGLQKNYENSIGTTYFQVSSVHWSTTRQEQLVISASWDGTVRLVSTASL